MPNKRQSILNKCVKFVQLRLPQTCFLCGVRVVGQQICADCIVDLPTLIGPCCPRCALPLLNGAICGACYYYAPAFDSTLASYRYAFPLDILVQQFKYAGVGSLAAFFAESMAESMAESVIENPLPQLDYLLPMPLHSTRLAQRGFNQAAEIARRLSPLIGVPWRADACQRVRATPPQAGLDLDARQHNLSAAFTCTLDLHGKRVALIDDVMTSGASLSELASVVRQAGAIEIRAWVVARTL